MSWILNMEFLSASYKIRPKSSWLSKEVWKVEMQLYGNAVFVSAEELSLINSIFPQRYINVDLQIFLVNVVRAFSNVESWGNLWFLSGNLIGSDRVILYIPCWRRSFFDNSQDLFSLWIIGLLACINLVLLFIIYIYIYVYIYIYILNIYYIYNIHFFCV